MTEKVTLETCDYGHEHGRLHPDYGEYHGCPVCLRIGLNKARAAPVVDDATIELMLQAWLDRASQIKDKQPNLHDCMRAAIAAMAGEGEK